jgi:hypothetical protein
MIIRQQNPRYNAPEYGIIFPIWFRRRCYDPNVDECVLRSPRLIVVFGLIRWFRFGFHIRVAVQ